MYWRTDVLVIYEKVVRFGEEVHREESLVPTWDAEVSREGARDLRVLGE